jgi:DNA-binding transcriptional ArsR family regulator
MTDRNEVSVRVMDLTGRASISVDVRTSLGCEMLNEIRAFTWSDARHTLEQPEAWFDELRTHASSDLKAGLTRLGAAQVAVSGALLSLVWEDPATTDVPGMVERLERTAPRDLSLAALGYRVISHREAFGPLMERAADGDAGAAEQLLRDPRYAAGEAVKVSSVRSFLEMGPEQAKRISLDVLRGWYEQVFRSREEDVRRILERDADAKRGFARQMTPEGLIDVATGGLQYTSEPGIRRVMLVPHIALRPWNLLNEFEETFIVFYPVADESLEHDREAPPARLLRLFRALDDEKRLRMLKVLARGPASLQELADAAGVAKSTAHHHTVILRSAGLLRVGLDEESRYSLRGGMVPEVSRGLADFMEERVT